MSVVTYRVGFKRRIPSYISKSSFKATLKKSEGGICDVVPSVNDGEESHKEILRLYVVKNFISKERQIVCNNKPSYFNVTCL